jgi:Flp pilus assembly protein TadD
VLFKYASLASQTGDLEGAISTLERMLLINADLPRVRLELGVLYYRLASYEVARTYLETALKSPNIPPDVRSRASSSWPRSRAS